MTFQDFDDLTERVFAQIREMRDTKGKEYAGKPTARVNDRFANFNRLAAKLGIDRKMVWACYSTKHGDAIDSFIRDGQTYSTETIQGRIIDRLVYDLLLLGMLEEDKQIEVTRLSGGLQNRLSAGNATLK